MANECNIFEIGTPRWVHISALVHATIIFLDRVLIVLCQPKSGLVTVVYYSGRQEQTTTPWRRAMELPHIVLVTSVSLMGPTGTPSVFLRSYSWFSVAWYSPLLAAKNRFQRQLAFGSGRGASNHLNLQ